MPADANGVAPSAAAGARLLLIGPVGAPRGGITIHVDRLSRELTVAGIGHTVLDESRVPKPGLPNIRQMTPFRYLWLLRRADVVHIHTSNRYVRLLHTLSARLAGCRVVHTVHGHDRRPLPKLCLRLACRLGHGCIAVSDAVAHEMGGANAVLPAFIGPGPEDEIVPPAVAAWIGEQRAAGRKIAAANASRPARGENGDIYGLDTFLESFAGIESFAGEAVRTRFAGLICVSDISLDPGYAAALQARIAELGLQDRVRFEIGNLEFCGVLKMSDVFVRPTLTDGDALSVREALWYGLAVIATDAAARPAEVITIRPRDAAALARALLSLKSGDRGVPGPRRDDFGRPVVAMLKQQLEL